MDLSTLTEASFYSKNTKSKLLKTNGAINLPKSNEASHLLKRELIASVTQKELAAVILVEKTRPKALRAFDQIPMKNLDLLLQAKFISSYLVGKNVVFVGDYDRASLLLGLLSVLGLPGPERMLVVDFDERVLNSHIRFARNHGFSDRLEVQLYNVFDNVPDSLIGKFDWFYTNPPYGSRNAGESVRLFITRGSEFTRPDSGNGCVIIPHDTTRLWTCGAMVATQRFLCSHNWTIKDKIDNFHQYHLDDDKELYSSSLLINHTAFNDAEESKMLFAGRQVGFEEIPYFYGLSVTPPYPRYIRANGKANYNWELLEGIAS